MTANSTAAAVVEDDQQGVEEAFADGSGGNNINYNSNRSMSGLDLENVLRIPLPGEVVAGGAQNNNNNATTTLFTRNLGYYNVTKVGYSYIRFELQCSLTRTCPVFSLRKYFKNQIGVHLKGNISGKMF